MIKRVLKGVETMSIANKCEQGDYVSNRLACVTAKNLISIAGVLELADKQASDTCVFNMRVQVPSPAPAASFRPQTSGGNSKNPNLITRRWGSDLSLLTAPNSRNPNLITC